MKAMEKFDQEKFEQIEAYLEGELSGDALQRFEAALKSDSALQKEVELHRDLAATTVDPEESAFSTMLRQIDAQTRATSSDPPKLKAAVNREKAASKNTGSVVSFRTWSVAIAAMLVLAAGAILFLPKSSDPGSLATANIEVYQAPAALRGETDNLKTTSKEGFAAYDRGDFEQAAKSLQTASEGIPNNPDILFFLGMSYLQLEQSQQAVSTFEQLGRLGDTQWSDDGEWHLMLALIQNKSLLPAKLLCSRIADSEGPFNSRAKKLLPRLERLITE